MDIDTEESIELQHHHHPHHERVDQQSYVGDPVHNDDHCYDAKHHGEEEEYQEQRELSVACHIVCHLWEGEEGGGERKEVSGGRGEWEK